MNSLIKLSDFVASRASSMKSVEVQPVDDHAPADVTEPCGPDAEPHHVIALPEPSTTGEDVEGFTQADIDAAEARGRSQLASALEEALSRHGEAVEQALTMAVRQIEEGVAGVCAELLQQVCEEQIGRMAAQQLARDAQVCLSQVADSVVAPVPVIEGNEEYAAQLEGLLQAAGIQTRRKAGAELDDESHASLKLHLGDTVLEALIGKWRQDLRECLQ